MIPVKSLTFLTPAMLEHPRLMLAAKMKSAATRRRERRNSAYARRDAAIAAAKPAIDPSAAEGRRAAKLARLHDRLHLDWQPIVQRDEYDDAPKVGRKSKAERIAIADREADELAQRKREDDLLRYAQRLAAKKYARIWKRLEHL